MYKAFQAIAAVLRAVRQFLRFITMPIRIIDFLKWKRAVAEEEGVPEVS